MLHNANITDIILRKTVDQSEEQHDLYKGSTVSDIDSHFTRISVFVEIMIYQAI